jgi:hypothetical protein
MSDYQLVSYKQESVWAIRLRAAFYGLVCFMALGITSVLVPIQAILMITLGVLACLLFAKLVIDNLRLARSLNKTHLISSFGRALLCFLPFVVLLIPGFLIGNTIDELTQQGIERLDLWVNGHVDETLQAKYLEIGRQIQEQQDKLQEQQNKLPWYMRALAAFYEGPDYKKQIADQFEAARNAAEAPGWVRGVAGILKAALLAMGAYSTAWVVVLVTRAFTSLFGRILVTGEESIKFQIATETPKPPRSFCSDSNPIQKGAVLPVHLPPRSCLYVREMDLPVNATPDLKLAWHSGCLLLRLRHGLVVLNKLSSEDLPLATTFQAQGSFQYVSLPLCEFEDVVINPSQLVAFSHMIRFRSHWSLNLAALTLHQPASLIASGPGLLIMKCDGQPVIYNDAAEVPAMSMNKLMSFQSTALFEIQASKGFLNYLASSCVIKPTTGGFFVANSEQPRRTSFFAKLWSLIKQVYLPI